MKLISLNPSLTGLILGLTVASLIPRPASAHPYASGITNNAGTIQFILNEDADKVDVVFDGGTSTNSLGPQSRGLHSFSLGVHTSYAIVVSKSGSGLVSLISPVPAAGVNTNLDFFGP